MDKREAGQAALIFNPAAGRREAHGHVREIADQLVERGWTVEWHERAPQISATDLARQAVAAGAEVVIAAGGDGTVNAVLKLKKRIGNLAYVWTALHEAIRYRGARVSVAVDGREIQRDAWLIMVSNFRLDAQSLLRGPVEGVSAVTDGLLDVAIFTGRTISQILPRLLLQLASRVGGRLTTEPEVEVEVLRGKEVSIRSSRALPVQADGEPIGETPMTFTVVPRAFHIIVPPEIAARAREAPTRSWRPAGGEASTKKP
ncbi:MAG: diacylglycerol kinase family protein [Ardenticatenaceae bacterium]|nr:diacylglycerol kinase family protein [Ardenticatenaceae bacterium]